MNSGQYKEFWKAHLRPWSKLPLFPRDMSFRKELTKIVKGKKIPVPLNRSNVISEKQYMASLGGAFNMQDCYVQVFSDWQIEKNIFDTLLFEIDVGGKNYDVDDILKDLALEHIIIKQALDKRSIAYRHFYTAGRSIHYYLDFEPVFIYDYRTTAMKFLKDIGILDMVDTSVLEPARISRVPSTKHLKTNRFAVYFDEFDVDLIREASMINKNLVGAVTSRAESKILDYLDLDAKPTRRRLSDTAYENRYEDWYPECVIRIIEKLMVNQHATHEERRHMTGYLKRFRFEDEEIANLCKNATDFQWDMTMDQIRSLDGHSNFSCRNVRLQMRDLCPGSCQYIRLVAKRLGEEGK